MTTNTAVWMIIGGMEVGPGQCKESVSKTERTYDCRVREDSLKVGDRVFVYMPATKQCNNHKLVQLFYGPYRVVEKHTGNVLVRPVDKPDSNPMIVSLSRVRVCPTEVSDVFWSDGRESETDEETLTWTSRL